MPNRCSLTSLVLWRMAELGGAGEQNHLSTAWPSVTPLTWKHGLISALLILVKLLPCLQHHCKKGKRACWLNFLKPNLYVVMWEHCMLVLRFKGIECLRIGSYYKKSLRHTGPKINERSCWFFWCLVWFGWFLPAHKNRTRDTWHLLQWQNSQ